MRIASINPSGKDVDFSDGVFRVGGEIVTKEQVLDYEKLGVLEWTNDELRNWALMPVISLELTSDAAQPSGARQTGRIIGMLFSGKHKRLAIIMSVAAVIGIAGILASVISSAQERVISNQAQAEIEQLFVREVEAANENNLRLAEGLRTFNKAYTSVEHWVGWGEVYISVNWSASFQDQILLTAAMPAQDVALQYMFRVGSTDPVEFLPNQARINQLDDSVKNWNATLTNEGFVVLDGYEIESLP